jgi:xanthine dehydrogenase YagT iron-sulfur-binding subunit
VNAVGPGDVPVRLTVNGKRVDLMIEPRTTLLDALRNRADLTGNKRGCDTRRVRRLHDDRRRTRGVCVLDARDRRAGKDRFATSTVSRRSPDCIRSSRHSATRRVDVRVLHARVRDGKRRAPRKTSIADARPDPKGLDGNICRCGTFSRIFEAVSSVKGVTRG